MILTTLVALALQAAPTLAAVENLSPEAAGEIVLAGRQHGPVARFIAPRRQGMDPPGWLRGEMVERAVANAEGCSRTRWNITFSQAPDTPAGAATLHDASAVTEVALPGPAGCPDDGYAQLNGGIQPPQAFAALRYLDDLRLRGAQAQITCSDETASRLCDAPRTIRRTLAALSPWAVMRKDRQMVFWLGGPGQPFTELRYDLDRPDQVTVSRKIPAPF